MKTLLILAPVLALIAGCAGHNNSGATGSMGSDIDAGYGNGVAPTQQGAGAYNLTNPQGLTNPQEETISQLSSSSMTFLQRAGQDGQAEVEMGQLIVQNAQNPALKQMGNRLIADHTLANQQLQALADQKGVTVSTQLEPQDQRALDRLSSLNGTDFDRAAEQQLISDHQRDIQMYQNAAITAQDPDIKAFAQNNVPVLQQHLDMAWQLLNNNSTTTPTFTQPPQ